MSSSTGSDVVHIKAKANATLLYTGLSIQNECQTNPIGTIMDYAIDNLELETLDTELLIIT